MAIVAFGTSSFAIWLKSRPLLISMPFAQMTAGAPFDIRPVGYRALESLRLEKGYRAWGSDITPNDTPFEAGLGWAVKLKSGLPFLGRKALDDVIAGRFEDAVRKCHRQWASLPAGTWRKVSDGVHAGVTPFGPCFRDALELAPTSVTVLVAE